MAYPMRIWDIPPPPGAEEYQPTPMPPAPMMQSNPNPSGYMNPGYYTGLNNMNYNCPPNYPIYPSATDSNNLSTHDRYGAGSSRRSHSPDRRHSRYSRKSSSPRRYDRYRRRSRSRSRRRSRSGSRYRRRRSRSDSRRRHRRSRSRSRKSRSGSRYSSRHRKRRSTSHSSKESKYSNSRSSSPSPPKEEEIEETRMSATSSQSSNQYRGLDRKSHKEFIKTKAQEYSNKHNQNADKEAANSFKNDGSFLDMFKKLQEEKTKKDKDPEPEETDRPEKILNIVAAASTLLEPSKPPVLPVVAKRRGGRILKTGVVEKKRFVVQEEQPKDAWAVYMKEVKRYKEACCDDDSKTRPLVK